VPTTAAWASAGSRAWQGAPPLPELDARAGYTQGQPRPARPSRRVPPSSPPRPAVRQGRRRQLGPAALAGPSGKRFARERMAADCAAGEQTGQARATIASLSSKFATRDEFDPRPSGQAAPAGAGARRECRQARIAAWLGEGGERHRMRSLSRCFGSDGFSQWGGGCLPGGFLSSVGLLTPTRAKTSYTNLMSTEQGGPHSRPNPTAVASGKASAQPTRFLRGTMGFAGGCHVVGASLASPQGLNKLPAGSRYATKSSNPLAPSARRSDTDARRVAYSAACGVWPASPRRAQPELARLGRGEAADCAAPLQNAWRSHAAPGGARGNRNSAARRARRSAGIPTSCYRRAVVVILLQRRGGQKSTGNTGTPRGSFNMASVLATAVRA
jgi:hypothetical protein